MARLVFKKIEPFGSFDAKITCELRSWFRRPVEAEFVGSSTVWHSFPDGKRQSTHLEMWFSDLYQREKMAAIARGAKAFTTSLA